MIDHQVVQRRDNHDDRNNNVINTTCTTNDEEIQTNSNTEPTENNMNANTNGNDGGGAVVLANRYRYVATGVVANARLSPLLPADWIDMTATNKNNNPTTTTTTTTNDVVVGSEIDEDESFGSETTTTTTITQSRTRQRRRRSCAVPDFLWENAPRHETKGIRDDVTVYSHLPNGINILDSKWVLGRLFSSTANNDDNNNNNKCGTNTNTTSGETNENPLLATCETHCFTGLDGFRAFARSVELLAGSEQPERDSRIGGIATAASNETQQKQQQQKRVNRQELQEIISNLPDIAESKQQQQNIAAAAAAASINTERPPLDVMNWWVVKDAGANGAGGVWVVGSENAESFGGNSSSTSSPEHEPEFDESNKSKPNNNNNNTASLLLPSHKYVAQQYVWPPVLYDGKKCHVRVYVTVTFDGRAFIHKRAFLHVANDKFTIDNDDNHRSESGGTTPVAVSKNERTFDDCIHITNCCANSHDDTKFAGEILADFGETSYTTWGGDGGEIDEHEHEHKQHNNETSSSSSSRRRRKQEQKQPVVPLADFFPSVKATVTEVVRRTFKRGLLDGGETNNGFEYCGMDFMLSYKKSVVKTKTSSSSITVVVANDNNNNHHAAVGLSEEQRLSSQEQLLPVAYLLEINSPPSQDTASSLPHAEGLHNEVLRDWMTCWVIPRIDPTVPIRAGGWMDCKINHHDHQHRENKNKNKNSSRTTTSSKSSRAAKNDHHEEAAATTTLAVPSKAAMLNKIRWALFERKLLKKEQQQSLRISNNGKGNGNNTDGVNANNQDDVVDDNDKGTQQQQQQRNFNRIDDDHDCKDDFDTNSPSAIQITRFARSQFPFFSAHSRFTDDNDNDDDDDDDDVGARGNRTDSDDVTTITTTQHQMRQSSNLQQIFFENAGGAQVPKVVIDHVVSSLTKRHREKIGSDTKAAARETLKRLLIGETPETITENCCSSSSTTTANNSSVVILGPNATSLMISLAQRYSGLLTPTDEVLISTENHLANFDPWIQAAKTAGAKIKLWAPFYNKNNEPKQQTTTTTTTTELPIYKDDSSLQSVEYEISSNLNDLVTPQTRIVALPHASNVLGSVRPISNLSKMIKDCSRGYAHIVVDGVAVAPHEFVGLDENFGGNVDWYVVSMHKLFGPHIGVLLARQNRSLDDLLETVDVSFPVHKTREERVQALLESGTANIEGCAGVVGLGMYFKSLSRWYRSGKEPDSGGEPFTNETTSADMVSFREARLAYSMIRKVEVELLKVLLRRLSRCPQVRVLDGSKPNGISDTKIGKEDNFRLPTVSFLHNSISSSDIYTHCQQRGIICRNGFFLCTKYLAADLNFDNHQDGALRVSLAHYNTPQEVQILCDTLESMPKWFGDI